MRLSPYLLLSPSAKEEFADLPGPSNPDAYDSVVIGLDEPSLSYTSLNIAFRILRSEPITTPAAEKPNRDRKPTLIAPHVSMFQQSPATDSLPGGLSLGIGPFVRALEAASGVEAEVVGKPTRRFFELAIKRLEELYPDIEGLGAGDVGVIGDDVVNDLGTGARELGMTRILGECGSRGKGKR